MAERIDLNNLKPNEEQQAAIDRLQLTGVITDITDKINKIAVLAKQGFGDAGSFDEEGEHISAGVRAKTIATLEVTWDDDGDGNLEKDEWDNSGRVLSVTAKNSDTAISPKDMEDCYKQFKEGTDFYQMAVNLKEVKTENVINNVAKVISVAKYSATDYSVLAVFGRMFFGFNYNVIDENKGTIEYSYYYNLDDYLHGPLTGKRKTGNCICGVSGCTSGTNFANHLYEKGKPISGRLVYALYWISGKKDCYSYGHNSSWIDFWWLVFSGFDKTSPIIRKYEIVNYKVQPQNSDRKQHTLFGTIREISKQFRKWLKSLGFKGHGLKFAFNGFVNWIKGFREGGRS